MSNYKIKQLQFEKAKKLAVEIKQSTRKNKKIDVFKLGKKIASIGDIRYSDYATYIDTRGKKYADERRRLYRLRHEGEQKKTRSPGYYSYYLLW